MAADGPAQRLPAPQAARGPWVEPAALVAAASVIAASLLLHFIRPHGDFYEFRETGRALLAGHVPETTKRGPVYPLLVALTGRLAALLPAAADHAPADQLGAALLSAASLPVIVLLVFLVTRRWSATAAPWAAFVTMIMPQLWLAGAQVLVEPLLALLMLLTVCLAQREVRWAYLCAAIAAVTRYDLAGLIAGAALADLLRGTPLRRVLARAALAGLPLVAWLMLTVWTWPTHGRDHYIGQMWEHAQRGALRFDAIWAGDSLLRAAGAAAKPGLPLWAADLGPLVHAGLPVIAGALLVLGALSGFQRRDSVLIVGVVAIVAYLAVHALFPFRLERFGFPPAPLAIAIGAFGASRSFDWLSRAGPLLRGVLLAAGLAIAIAAAAWELDALHAIWPILDSAAQIRISSALAAAVVIGGAAFARNAVERSGTLSTARSFATIALGVGLAFALTLANGRDAWALLGKRGRPSALVDAARWICHELSPDSRVLSGVGGLLALHGDSGVERFPGFEQMDAADWDGIVRECRAQRIEHVLWYEGFLEEQGEYYVAKWRLERFAPLDQAAAPGVAPERRFEGQPAVVLYRITTPPTQPATRPSAASSSGGAPTDTARDAAGWPTPSPPRKSP